MRLFWCPLCEDFHPRYDRPRNCDPPPPQRSMDLSAPSVIRDEMPVTMGMHNGKRYTSKRALRDSYRRHGMVEVGNDPIVTGEEPKAFHKRNPPKREHVKEAVEKALSHAGLGENPVITGIKGSDGKVKRAKHF